MSVVRAAARAYIYFFFAGRLPSSSKVTVTQSNLTKMENPTEEIFDIVRVLCQGSPPEQQKTLRTYFTPDAEFIHPFCRVNSSSGSRDAIGAIFRWYKVMSPRIQLSFQSAAFDEKNHILYVSLQQTFHNRLLPFSTTTPRLTTVLHLRPGLAGGTANGANGTTRSTSSPTKYYIASQQDLYQTTEFVKFIVPWFDLGSVLVYLWQMFATAMCVLGVWLFGSFL